MGYFPLGVAFGVLAKSMGVSAFIAVALSTLAYGGAAQFMMLSLFSVGTSYVEVFIVSYLVNLRHTFYGISLLKEYSGIKFRLLNIALLTDETFAIFKNLKLKEASDRSFVFTLNLLSWSYWAAGTLLGALLGDLIKADTKGLEFSLTALFIVIVIEMFKNDRNYHVLFVATFFGVLGVSLFPAKFVLVGSMALCFIFLLLFKDKI